jgi:hypothetical protein
MPFGVVSILSPCRDVAFLHGQDPEQTRAHCFSIDLAWGCRRSLTSACNDFEHLGGTLAYRFALLAGLFVWASVIAQAVVAAELKVLSANVFTGVLDNVFSDFERSFGHKDWKVLR